jgi:hypothetical protein
VDHTQLSREIYDMFADRHADPAKWISDNIENLNVYNVAALMRSAAKGRVQLSGGNLIRLSEVVARGRIAPKDESKVLGGLLYGMQKFKDTDPGVSHMLLAIMEKMHDTVTSMDGQFFGNALYGMQHMGTSEPAVLAVVAELARKMYLSQSEVDAQVVSNALYGMQNMDNSHAEVNQLLQALSLKLNTSPDMLYEPRHFSLALYGLQSMRQVTPELEGVLAHLTTLMYRCNAEYTSQNIGSAFFGLSGLSSLSSPAVRRLLEPLNDALNTVPHGTLDDRAVMTVFQGLAGGRGEYEVRKVLETIGKHVALSNHKYTAKQLERIVSSLRGCSSEHAEVRAAVRALSTRLSATHTLRLQHRSLPPILNGLADLKNDTEDVRRFLIALLKMFPHPCAPPVTVDTLDYLYNASEICALLHGLKSMSSHEEVGRRLMNNILSLVGPVTACPADKVQWDSGASEVLQAVQSLRGKRGVDEGVPQLLALVNVLVKRSPAPVADFPVNELMRSLLSLQSLLSPQPSPAVGAAVCLLLGNLAPALVGAAEKNLPGGGVTVPITPDELSEIFYSFRGLDKENKKKLVPFLRVIKKYCRRLDSPLSPAALCRFLAGMAKMDCREVAVSSLLSELVSERKGGRRSRAAEGTDADGSATEAKADGAAAAAGSGHGEAVDIISDDLLMSALRGCRQLSAVTPAGTAVLEKLAEISMHVQPSAPEERSAAYLSARCSALVGLRGFCDPLVNAAELERGSPAAADGDAQQQQQQRVDNVCTLATDLLGPFRGPFDGSADGMISPLQYGCLLTSSVDLVDLLVTSPDEGSREPLSEARTAFLLRLEEVLLQSEASLGEWAEVLTAAAVQQELKDRAQTVRGARRNADTSVPGVLQKRPPVTSSDVKLLREALHMSKITFERLAAFEARPDAASSAVLTRLAGICDRSAAQVDAKHPSHLSDADANTNADHGHMDGVEGDCEEGSEGMSGGGSAVSASCVLRVGGLTYAEKRYSNYRRKFRNFLAEACLTGSFDLVVPKVNPVINGIFSTDIILSYDAEGADLAQSMDMDAKLPYHHLLHPDVFTMHSTENASTIRHIVLDVEKKNEIYSSDCGMTDQLLGRIKTRFLRTTLGEENVGHMWNPEEVRRESKSKTEGFVQLTPDELKTKKLVFFNVSLEDFEGNKIESVFSSIMNNLGFKEKERPRESDDAQETQLPSGGDEEHLTVVEKKGKKVLYGKKLRKGGGKKGVEKGGKKGVEKGGKKGDGVRV